jgi:hypothetical protein
MHGNSPCGHQVIGLQTGVSMSTTRGSQVEIRASFEEKIGALNVPENFAEAIAALIAIEKLETETVQSYDALLDSESAPQGLTPPQQPIKAKLRDIRADRGHLIRLLNERELAALTCITKTTSAQTWQVPKNRVAVQKLWRLLRVRNQTANAKLQGVWHELIDRVAQHDAKIVDQATLAEINPIPSEPAPEVSPEGDAAKQVQTAATDTLSSLLKTFKEYFDQISGQSGLALLALMVSVAGVCYVDAYYSWFGLDASAIFSWQDFVLAVFRPDPEFVVGVGVCIFAGVGVLSGVKRISGYAPEKRKQCSILIVLVTLCAGIYYRGAIQENAIDAKTSLSGICALVVMVSLMVKIFRPKNEEEKSLEIAAPVAAAMLFGLIFGAWEGHRFITNTDRVRTFHICTSTQNGCQSNYPGNYVWLGRSQAKMIFARCLEQATAVCLPTNMNQSDVIVIDASEVKALVAFMGTKPQTPEPLSEPPPACGKRPNANCPDDTALEHKVLDGKLDQLFALLKRDVDAVPPAVATSTFVTVRLPKEWQASQASLTQTVALLLQQNQAHLQQISSDIERHMAQTERVAKATDAIATGIIQGANTLATAVQRQATLSACYRQFLDKLNFGQRVSRTFAAKKRPQFKPENCPGWNDYLPKAAVNPPNLNP